MCVYGRACVRVYVCVRMRVCVCVCVCTRACVRACVGVGVKMVRARAQDAKLIYVKTCLQRLSSGATFSLRKFGISQHDSLGKKEEKGGVAPCTVCICSIASEDKSTAARDAPAQPTPPNPSAQGTSTAKSKLDRATPQMPWAHAVQ